MRTALLIHRPRSWFVEGRVVRLAENFFANCRQYVIVVIVANIERQVPVDAFERAWSIQTARATRSNTVLQGALCQMLDHVPGSAPGDLCFVAFARLPHL